MKNKICPICGSYKYRSNVYSEWGIGIVEEHSHCKRCGYTVEQCYNRPLGGFMPMIKRGYESFGVYYPKNSRKRKRMKRRFHIRYSNEDRYLSLL